MFVVFEGIDGGGKTTLSNRVAALLRERGLAVEHVREGGRFASNVTQAMRELGRDARNFAMTPRAELMLYLTREVQLLEEATRPALGRADVVIADRYIYTAEALAVYGRGMAPHDVAPVVASAAHGLFPDIVVLVDVDPNVARARRRVSKLVTPDAKPPSRKGLAGTALQRRLRRGYLELAARDPDRWFVIDNTDADLEPLAVQLADAVERARTGGAAAARTSLPRPAASPGLAGHDLRSAREALLAWVDRRAEREPGLAAYFLDGVTGPEFDARRSALASRAPAVIAAGLRWLDDPAAWKLRHELAAIVPGQVARSLASPAGAHANAPTLLRALVEPAPREVGAVLWGRDDELAWELRARLPHDLAVRSLGAVVSARAWELRDRWIAQLGGLDSLHDVAVATLACQSVEAIGDDRAWELRKAMRDVAPVAALDSLYLLEDDRSWKWRERDVERAPKIVMRTIGQSDDPRAWALRDRVGSHCEETLDSIVGLDSEPAWQLRAARLEVWPSSAVKSLGPLALTDRGRELVATALARSPTDIALWRHALVVGTRGGGAPRW